MAKQQTEKNPVSKRGDIKPGDIKVEYSDAGMKSGNNQPESPDQTEQEEIGGPKGPEPTRYGDWEVNGRCSDF